MKDQIRRAAVSIVSNIAEGDESGSNKNCVRYFNISKASVAEVYTQIIIAHEIGYVDNESFFKIENTCKELGAMLYKLIEKRKQS